MSPCLQKVMPPISLVLISSLLLALVSNLSQKAPSFSVCASATSGDSQQTASLRIESEFHNATTSSCHQRPPCHLGTLRHASTGSYADHGCGLLLQAWPQGILRPNGVLRWHN